MSPSSVSLFSSGRRLQLDARPLKGRHTRSSLYLMVHVIPSFTGLVLVLILAYQIPGDPPCEGFN